MATIKKYIKDNIDFLTGVFEGQAQHTKNMYDSLFVTTLLKANIRGILYDLKLHHTRGAIQSKELINLQHDVAKIIVSLMYHYLGELNSNPYIDTFYFNVFYSNLTFEIEDHFEMFSTFKETSESMDDDYVKAFKEYGKLELNEHTADFIHFQKIREVFKSHKKALTDWLVSFSQIYLTFKLIHNHADSEGHQLPSTASDVENHLNNILKLFESEIKTIEPSDILNVIRRNYSNFIKGDSFKNLYYESDENDLSDEIIYEKLDPETQEAIRMFEIFWEKDEDSFPSMLKGTYLLAWADLIVKDTSTQRNKVTSKYGPFLETNKSAIAAMMAFSFGEDVFENHRSESYKYI